MHRAFDLKPTKIDAEAAFKSGLTKRLCDEIIQDIRAAEETRYQFHDSPLGPRKLSFQTYSSHGSLNVDPLSEHTLRRPAPRKPTLVEPAWRTLTNETIGPPITEKERRLSMSVRLPDLYKQPPSTDSNVALTHHAPPLITNTRKSLKSDHDTIESPSDSHLTLPIEVSVTSEQLEHNPRGSMVFAVPDKVSIIRGLLRKDSDKSDISSLHFQEDRDAEIHTPGVLPNCSDVSQYNTDRKQPPIKYNRLATPRSQEVKVCCICRKAARFQCDTCRSAFYCSMDHYYDDINHEVLCQDLRELQKLMKEGQKNDDPFKRQFFVKSMEIQQESCLKKILYSSIYCIANNLITTANYSLNQALIGCKEMFGPGSVQCLEILMLKAHCSCMMGHVKDAKQEMGLAEIVIEHNPDVATHDDVKADMSYVSGMCYMVEGDFDQARFFLADSIYWRSFSNNADTVISVRCFLCLGEIAEFAGDHRMAKSIYEHCLQDYLDWLLNNLEFVLTPVVKEFQVQAQAFEFKPIQMPLLIEGDLLKGIKKLVRIYENEKDVLYYKCLLSLSIICFLKGDFTTSSKLIHGCKSQLHGDVLLTRYIKRMAKVMGSEMTPLNQLIPMKTSYTKKPKFTSSMTQRKSTFGTSLTPF